MAAVQCEQKKEGPLHQTKTFEHSRLWVDQRRRMQRVPYKAIRISVVLATIVAWLSISNHCAIGGLIETGSKSAMPRMHCHGNQPSPSKKSSQEEMPCCKVLRATLAGQGKIVQVASKDFLPIPNWIIAQVIFADDAQLRCLPEELDTGPPFVDSFAESVLQRSLLAHAPPVSLS